MAACLLASLSHSVLALNPDRLPTQYMYDHYTRADGLPAGAIWSVIQDSDGYLWVGTQNGLARFDGTRFTIFDASNTPGLTSQDIRSVVIDQNDQMWLGSYGGGVYRFDSGKVEAIGVEQGLPHSIVYDLRVDEDGALWIATASGLARREVDGSIQAWTEGNGAAINRVFSIFQDRSGAIWLATFGGGLSRFDGGQFEHYGTDDGLKSNQVHTVYQDRAGRLLIGSYEGGFQEFKNGRFEDLELPVGMAGLAIQAIFEDGNNNLWLGAYNNGLIRYRDGSVAHLNFEGLERAIISDIIEDAEGSLWLATNKGLQRLRDGKVTVYGQAEGLADSTFVVTGNPSNSDVWVGTEGHGLFRLAGDTIQQLTQAEDGLASDNISALMFAPNDDLWIGSFGAGVNRLRDGSISVLGQSEGLTNNHIFAFEMLAEQQLWVATFSGISRLDNGQFTNFGVDQGLPAAAIRTLFKDREGRLWMGSNGSGLAWMSDDGISKPDFNADLSGSIVHVFHQDGAGRIWIGFRDGGLGLLLNDQDVGFEFVGFGAEQGLPFMSVNAIEEDADGFLWLATGAGLVRAPISELLDVAEGRRTKIEPMVLTESDGLRSVQFAGGFQPTSWQDPAGKLWFTSTNGLVHVDPNQLSLNDRPPPVRIESLVADGVSLATDRTIELPPDAANVEIKYTGLSLVSPSEVHFRYRLLGFDRDWQDVGSRRTAYYTGLPNGQYEFQVLARNNDGVWSPQPAQLQIVQLAKLHEQAWFISLCILIAITFIAALLRYWVTSARRREQRLAEEVRERTYQLEKALDEVERGSRIDGLTGVANRGYFEKRLNRAWAAARAEQRKLGLVMIDLDRFKRLNDNYGHQVGDDALKVVAQALTASVYRSGDLVARYGGEEFVVLLPGADLEAVGRMAEKMRETISQLDDEAAAYGGDQRSVPALTLSAGGASMQPSKDCSPRDLIAAADGALYRAKDNGRNRVELATD